MNLKDIGGKIIYSIIFLLLIPAGLWLWSMQTRDIISWPAVHYPLLGIVLTATGMLLILSGMWALRHYGNGLPMNAYPPENYVSQGAFRIVKHPIYTGFGVLIIGVSIWTGSASLLWLVSPITIMGMIALVMGYEMNDLENRFGTSANKALFDIPSEGEVPLKWTMRISTVLMAAGIALLSRYWIIIIAGTAEPVASLFSSLDSPWKYAVEVITWTLFPMIASEHKQLRNWILSILAIHSIFLFALLTTSGLWNVYGTQTVSYFVEITISSSIVVFGYFSFNRSGIAGWLLTAISVSALILVILSNGDILTVLLSSIILVIISLSIFAIWKGVIILSELIANSWKEWVFGPIRIINHGIYVGIGALLGSYFIARLAGEGYIWGIVIFAYTVIIFSALWAQLIEGSEKLKRPFGYYGAIVGIAFAGLIVWSIGYDVWVIIGATSVMMPWIQATGRLRCLVNGCCHGKPIKNEQWGIRYKHPRSRVTNISGLKNIPLHPTPSYSIAWLFFTGFVLLAFWMHGMSPTFIFGMYLILTGLGRFVEEAFRGEVQTPILFKLRLYQWTAVATILVGIIFTCLPLEKIYTHPGYITSDLTGALLIGIFTFFAMGVDFPRSNKRFSRLV